MAAFPDGSDVLRSRPTSPVEDNCRDNIHAIPLTHRANENNSKTVPLALPIAFPRPEGTWQDTLGPYFHLDNKLYAITSRRILNGDVGRNEEYRCDDFERKDVLLMDESQFTEYVTSISRRIVGVGRMVDLTAQRIKYLQTLKKGKNINRHYHHLFILQCVSRELDDFLIELKGKWSDPKNRMIGSVVWSPPLAGEPNIQDLCVLQLDKEKFINLIGNILSLGPEVDPKSELLICDVELGYPQSTKGLRTLRDILAANLVDYIEDADPKDPNGKPVRRVLTHGFAPNTMETLDTLTRFLSYRRLAPFIDADLNARLKDKLALSGGAGCGSVAARFVRLLASGTSNDSETTYDAPLECVWQEICQKFLGADLHFDDLDILFSRIMFDAKIPFQLDVEESSDEE